jgi:hypothetical protein
MEGATFKGRDQIESQSCPNQLGQAGQAPWESQRLDPRVTTVKTDPSRWSRPTLGLWKEMQPKSGVWTI